ncbi:MAG: DUF4392 domain-containing protein, partial [Oscillospiraceae bacterium]|nr:DUF4392 domain-containing protein [Oscillospiraceae bacterium]
MTVEDIILLHSKRGMNILREHCAPDFCHEAARCIYDAPRGNVLLTTGFYVGGFGETDGPPGTMFLAKALYLLGFNPIIVTDDYCQGFFMTEHIQTVYVTNDMGEADYAAMLDQYAPTLLISIERCGRNIQGDYANMRGVSIADHNARVDWLFELGARRGIPSVGVGDGGNEIGMGNLKEVISNELSLVPCEVEVSHLVIATVSNWGAYGLCACLEELSGQPLLPRY